MRVLVALTIGLSGGLSVGSAMAQGLAPVDAINRCESFVESAMRPEFSASFKHPYKVVCYFGLIDDDVAEDHHGVCARLSAQFAPSHRVIAEYMCTGAYEAHLSATGR
ncbi:hypothetical protein NO932_03755 [Pelagibacterium sp. 26DY04]|uniref:hypothetical protein n=1 Tax=Pelagibacterium sp. 26DY04 TaxID=2967130 RepID=UPI0028165741|nr:hypothetical protein [Pelagibacterium sp. 26DY04]WMT87735.1 hypothetical protein NO932_03755 [Pelagibacterium sp. 26DY04]